MTNHCIVKNCLNSSISSTLFESPSDKNLLKRWQRVITTKQERFYVCERHFPKSDLIIEKNVKDTAIPSIHLINVNIELKEDCCGLCLELMEDEFKIQKEDSDAFMEIIGYEPVTSYMCENCRNTLKTYKKFQTEIQEKHAALRRTPDATSVKKQELEDDSDDCVMIDDSRNYSSADDFQDNFSNDDYNSPNEVVEEPAKKSSCKPIRKTSLKKPARNSRKKATRKKKQPIKREKFLDDQIDKQNLKTEILTSRDFLCHICSKGFKKQSHLTLHLRSHNQEDKKYFCDLCGRKFHQVSEIRTHIKRIHSDRSTQLKAYHCVCQICNKKYPYPADLKKHVDGYHKDGYDCGARANPETNNYDCERCGGTYGSIYNYRVHKCEHGRSQIKCFGCKLPLKKKSLASHLKICKNLQNFGSYKSSFQ